MMSYCELLAESRPLLFLKQYFTQMNDAVGIWKHVRCNTSRSVATVQVIKKF